ncbi:MAG: competence ComEA-like helix-hairpin-helix protein [Kiritimatiellia bacterium]|jgi:competence ComEA-like helix-hairpin-helix protein
MNKYLLPLVVFFTSTLLHADPLQTLEGVSYVETAFGDGDSFMVKHDGKTHVIRLYYIDCPETQLGQDSDRRRVLEQSRYFAVDGKMVIKQGKIAAAYVRELLSKQSFTVHTAFARAGGRSGKPRVYAFVTLEDGSDLAARLVLAGLSRAHGIKRQTPGGLSAEDYDARLGDLELTAAIMRNGIWALSEADKLAVMREKQREDQRELALELGAFSSVSEDHPLNVNTATLEDLQQINGIGPVTAEAIIAGRPYKSLVELDRVRGIGPGFLKKATPYLVIK